MLCYVYNAAEIIPHGACLMTRILIIEDQDPLRKDVMEMLTYEGYEVIEAADGSQGVERALEHLPDLIICDVMMPGMDGYHVLAELREKSPTALTPFVFLTARTGRYDHRYGMELGANDFLTKPFKVTELLGTVRTQLRMREVYQQAIVTRLKGLQDNIIFSLPHELRTPLTSIMGYSDLLTQDAYTLDRNQIVEMSERIHLSSLRLSHVIENYLVYAQLELAKSDDAAHQQLLNKRTSNPHEIIEYVALQKAQEASRTDDLLMSVAPVTQVRVDEEYLNKILWELVDNAFKFSASGKTVEVSAYLSDNYYVICIRDHGRGLAPEQLNEIGAYMQFNRLLQEQQGIGLGLVLAKRLTELHRGHFHIESTVNEGTQVCVSLLLG